VRIPPCRPTLPLPPPLAPPIVCACARKLLASDNDGGRYVDVDVGPGCVLDPNTDPTRGPTPSSRPDNDVLIIGCEAGMTVLRLVLALIPPSEVLLLTLALRPIPAGWVIESDACMGRWRNWEARSRLILLPPSTWCAGKGG
jgi:hypothetical protein